MIVDCHTHIWQTADQLGQADLGEPTPMTARKTGRRGAGGRTVFRRIPPADPELHWQASLPVDRCIVMGFRSRLLKAEVPNNFVADYVKRHPDKLIGFAGIDPTVPEAMEEFESAIASGLRGITVSPSNQGFHPADSRAMEIFELCQRKKLPVLFHSGGHLSEQSRLEYARPMLLDEVARSFPSLRIILAQLGQPWCEEAALLLAKHSRVFADVSGLLSRSWQAYQALLLAYQYGVADKLLFGSDFPYTSAAGAIESLYSINQMTQGTGLPTVPREALRGIVECDALGLLGLD